MQRKNDIRLSYALVIYFCALISNYTLKHLLDIGDPTTRAAISAAFMLGAGALFLLHLPTVLERIGKTFVFTYSIAFALFLFTVMFFPRNIVYLPEVGMWFLLISLPVSLYYMAIKDKTVFFSLLTKSAYYQLALGLLFVAYTLYIGEPHYDMVFSYLVLVPVLLLANKAMKQKVFGLDFFLTLIGVVAILWIGSRGPVLAFTVFILLRILFSASNMNGGYSIIRRLGFMAFLLVVWLNLDVVLVSLERWFLTTGLPSRAVFLLLRSSAEGVDFLTGRAQIWSVAMNSIYERPIWGYGIAGDRVFLYGTYPHNLFLEVLVQFGVILGLLIITAFIAVVLLGWIKASPTEREFIAVFIGLGLVPLMVSGSFWVSANFWLLIAICLSPLRLQPYRRK